MFSLLTVLPFCPCMGRSCPIQTLGERGNDGNWKASPCTLMIGIQGTWVKIQEPLSQSIPCPGRTLLCFASNQTKVEIISSWGHLLFRHLLRCDIRKMGASVSSAQAGSKGILDSRTFHCKHHFCLPFRLSQSSLACATFPMGKYKLSSFKNLYFSGNPLEGYTSNNYMLVAVTQHSSISPF